MEWVIMVIVTLVLSGTSMSCGKSTGCVFCQDVGLPGLPDSYQFFSFPAPLPLVVFLMQFRWTRRLRDMVTAALKDNTYS